MKKLLKLGHVFLILLLVVSLAACTSTTKDTSGKSSDGGNKGKDSGQIVLRIMDWSDSVKDIHKQFDDQFMKEHPNIKIEYTQLTIDQYKNTILTAVNSGDAPDLFPVPTGMKLQAVVKDGWYQPLDPYIDDNFKNAFEDGTFQNGTTMVDGKIYSIPEAKAMPSSLLFYNKKLFEAAGLDPNSPPKTYSEFRDAAKKITKAGKGKFFGIIEGGKQENRWTTIAREWSSLGGAGLNGNSPINLATGKTTYDSQPVLDVFNLFSELAKDGSYHPKSMSISAPEARALFGQGQAGLIVQGAWCIGVWNKENPDLDYGVMAPPVPDSGRKGSIPITSNQPWVGLSATSKHPKEAVEYLKEYYLGDFFQKARVGKGDAFSVVKGINEKYATVPQLKQYYQITQDFGRLIPDPAVRNPESTNVFAYYKDVQPSFGQLLGGVVAGSIKNPKSVLTNYSNRVDKAWSQAIKDAQAKNVKVKASDFVFPNWNPMKGYTTDDYKALNN